MSTVQCGEELRITSVDSGASTRVESPARRNVIERCACEHGSRSSKALDGFVNVKLYRSVRANTAWRQRRRLNLAELSVVRCACLL